MTKTRSGGWTSGGALLALGLALSIGPFLMGGAPVRANRIPEDALSATEEPAPMLEELDALRTEMRAAAGRLIEDADAGHPRPVPVALVQFLRARAFNGFLPEDSALATRLGGAPGGPERGEALTGQVGERVTATPPVGGIDPALRDGVVRVYNVDMESPGVAFLDLSGLGYGLVAHVDAYITGGRAEHLVAARRAALLALKGAEAGLKHWPTPYPDALGWAALGLARYGSLAHDDSALAMGRALLERMDLRHAPPADSDASSSARLAARAAAALAVELQTNPAPMAYIIGKGGSAELGKFQAAALKARRPQRLISVHDRGEPDLLYPADAGGRTIVYVCSGEACAAPVRTTREMVALLESFARPEPPARKP